MAPTLAFRRRPPSCRRSWLFLPGAEREILRAAPQCGADALILELEDFTPPHRRAEARGHAGEVLRQWREAGRIAAARVNPLALGGHDDLAAIMPAAPDVVMLAMAQSAEDVRALDAAISALERTHGLPQGSTEIVPNVETVKALTVAAAVAQASPRVTALLLATEDLAADLGAERTRAGDELAYARRRFLVECVAAGVLAIDCPYTFDDADGAETDARAARALGYKSKSLVDPGHAKAINRAMTPSAEEAARATRLVEAFEAARAQGAERALVDGLKVEVPTWRAAKRLLARRGELAEFEEA